MNLETIQRFEYKFRLSVFQRDKLILVLSPFLIYDTHSRNNHYNVRTLYFDSSFKNHYFQKIEGLNNRVKLRFRVYPNEDQTVTDKHPCFIELKLKSGNYVFKRRINLLLMDAMNIIAPSMEIDQLIKRTTKENVKEFLNEAVIIQKRYNLKPTSLVSYKRQALIYKFDKNIKISFDTDIKAQTRALSLKKELKTDSIIPRNQCVMEIKFKDKIPKIIINALKGLDTNITRFSKFTKGLESKNLFVLR